MCIIQYLWHQNTAKNQTSKAGQLMSSDGGTKDIPSQLHPIGSKGAKRLSKTDKLRQNGKHRTAHAKVKQSKELPQHLGFYEVPESRN